MSSCKELISILHREGGKFICDYDRRECSLSPQNKIAKVTKITKDDSSELGLLLFDLANTGDFNKYVKFLPESEKSKKDRFVPEHIHDFQEKNTGGFVVEWQVDNHGYITPKVE